MVFLEGAATASVVWALVLALGYWRHRVHVQAALNLPAASSHAELKSRMQGRVARGPVR